jgi:hypothetical protein
MPAECGVRFAILALRSVPSPVGENCPQAVEVCARYVEMFIDNDTRKILAHALPHYAGLGVIDSESLFLENGGD